MSARRGPNLELCFQAHFPDHARVVDKVWDFLLSWKLLEALLQDLGKVVENYLPITRT